MLYKSSHNQLCRFPEVDGEDLSAGPKRNFQIFEPLDFLAEVTQHIPEVGEHLIRYYGWYSNKKRGERAKRLRKPEDNGATVQPPTAREARKKWAALDQAGLRDRSPHLSQMWI